MILAFLAKVEITPETKDSIKSTIKSGYDAWCVRVDIPRLPERLEAMVENAAWSLVIEPTIDAVLAKVG